MDARIKSGHDEQEESSPVTAEGRRPSWPQAQILPRRPCGARFRPGPDRRASGRAGRGPGSRAVVLHQTGRAGMGTSLWTRSPRVRPRPRAFSPGAGPQCRGCRLGPGRGAEKRRADRRPGGDRDQDAAGRTPAQPCRASLAHALPLVVRIRAARAARDFDRLAHRGDGKRVSPLRRKRTWHTLLAAHARALPGRGAGAQLYRGVQSWVVSFPSFCRIFRSSG